MLERDPSLRARLVVPVVGGPSGSGLEHPEAHRRRWPASLGIDDVVRFVPPVERTALADWYAAATLVCVPSYNESFGLVAMEAAAVGTPVVAAAVGGLSTAVRDGRDRAARRRARPRRLRRRAIGRDGPTHPARP